MKKCKTDKISVTVTADKNVSEIIDDLVEKVPARRLLMYLYVGMGRFRYGLPVPNVEECAEVSKMLVYVNKHWKELLPRAEACWEEVLDKADRKG